jgi:predicted DsbA family dithiol-disulfide isomerase
VKFTHFPLHPDTPPEGRSLEDLFAGRGLDIAEMRKRLEALAAAEGLPYGDRTHTYNSRLAQELGKWAEGRPGGEQVHDVLFRAYFVDAVNIGNPEVLVDLAEKAGLDAAEAGKVLQERSFSDAVDEDWQRSMAMGVTGVPTFVIGQYGVVGAQSYETLEMLVQKADAVPNAESRQD